MAKPSKIAKFVDEFAAYLACRPHKWVHVKTDKYGGVQRRCTKCKVRETSYPAGTTQWPKRASPKVTLKRARP